MVDKKEIKDRLEAQITESGVATNMEIIRSVATAVAYGYEEIRHLKLSYETETTMTQDISEFRKCLKVIGYKLVSQRSDNDKVEHYYNGRGEKSRKGGTKRKIITIAKK